MQSGCNHVGVPRFDSVAWREVRMADRRNLKIALDTWTMLKADKRDTETWDSYLRRMHREAFDQ